MIFYLKQLSMTPLLNPCYLKQKELKLVKPKKKSNIPTIMDVDKPQISLAKSRATIQDRIESAQYNLSQDMLNRKADITFGQLITIVPTFTSDMSKKKILAYSIESKETGLDNFETLNLINDDSQATSARTCVVVNGKMLDCLVDCGASKCIMSRQTKDLLNLEIDSSSNTTFILGDNRIVSSLGLIYDVPLKVGSVVIPITIEVLESTPLPSYHWQ